MNGKKEISLALGSPERGEPVIEFRSLQNHHLLVTLGAKGLYFWERKGRTQHIFPWKALLKYIPMSDVLAYIKEAGLLDKAA